MSGLLDSYECATREGYGVQLSLLVEVKLGIETEDAMAQGHDVQWGEKQVHKGTDCLFCQIRARRAVPSSPRTSAGENPNSWVSPLLVILQTWDIPLPWGGSVVLKM